jgi:hypothetical protein
VENEHFYLINFSLPSKNQAHQALLLFTGINETLFFYLFFFFTHTVKWKYSPQQKVSLSKQHAQDDKTLPPTEERRR